MNPPMTNAILHGSILTLKLLERFIKADIKTRGEENIPENPILYVVNHFTRVETFILPYIIKKATKSMPNSLADSSLFKGKFEDYLSAVGAMSVGSESRNDIIVGDLITGRKNWVIFPEGAMIKTKKVIRSRHLRVSYPGRDGPIHTGAAYLALLSELYKRAVITFLAKGDNERIQEFLQRFCIEGPDEISQKETVIIPTNLTYFPIRPGKNVIQSLASRFIKGIPERLEEELEIEGNLLFSGSHIYVTFGEPVMVRDFLDRYYFKKNRLLSLFADTRRRLFYGDDPARLKLARISRRLTNHFMDRIYSMVTVNMDHLFSLGLTYLNRNRTSDYLFKCKLFLASEEIKQKGFNLAPSLNSLLIELVADERDSEYNDFEELALQSGIIEKTDGAYIIHRRRLEASHEFHSVRLENTIRVIANEIEHVRGLRKIIRKEFRSSEKKIRSRMMSYLREFDRAIFKDDYRRYYDEELSKPEQIGAPFYLQPGKSRVGVLLCHGYLSVPQEVRVLGEYLAKFGYTVYGPRLKGHGTSPYNLADVTWNDWYESFNRGYAVLRNACERIIIGGFSTGGTLALLAAANKGEKIGGVFTVNAPLQLKNIKTKFVGPIHFWNEILEKLKIDEGKLEYVDNCPENPEINYTKNCIKGVRELGLLMDRAGDRLERISVPALVIQEKNDPVVDPRSASIILDNISSEDKEFYSFEYNRHGILCRDGCDEVFFRIKGFIDRVMDASVL